MNKEKIIDSETSYSVGIVNNNVDALRVNDNKSTSVRVYENGCIGVAGAIGDADETELTKRAVKNLSFGVKYPCDFTKGLVKSVNDAKKIPTANDFMKQVESLVAKLSDKYPDYVFSNKVNVESKKVIYTNSENTSLDYASSAYDTSIMIKAKSSANIFDLGYGAKNDVFDADAIVDEISVLLNAYETPIDFPDEKLPVIIDSASLAGHIVNGLVAETFLSGASLFSGKSGQKIFNEKVSLCFDRTPNNDSKTPFFDKEGTVKENYKFDLVKNGVLKGLVATKRTAAMFGIESSGTSVSTFDSVPMAGAGGYTFEPTCKDLTEIINGKAIYVYMTSGGDMTPAGDLGMPVMLAYLYDNGKLTGRLPEFGIGGNIFDVLGKNFVGICRNDIFNYDKHKVLVSYFDINK